MISCIDLSFSTRSELIFNQFGFSMLSHSIYVLKGRNGSGKTSLLKIIAGLVKPDNGKVLWNNKPINNNYYYKHCLSYLGHENAIKANLSVIDNLMLWADLKGNHLLVPGAIAHFKLDEFADTKCKYLSAGWQRRVALARMIISNGKLWILDEPEANLDEEGRDLLLKLLQVKISSGGMVIIASHNLEYYKKIPAIDIGDFKYAI